MEFRKFYNNGHFINDLAIFTNGNSIVTWRKKPPMMERINIIIDLAKSVKKLYSKILKNMIDGNQDNANQWTTKHGSIILDNPLNMCPDRILLRK